MHVEKNMHVADGLCIYRPQGEVSLVDAVELITDAIADCRARNIPKLLVDVTRLTGYPVPTLADRFWMVQDWSQAARGEVTLAVVALPEHIDPNKFGVKAAADAGLKGDVFTSLAEAEKWLRDDGSPQAGLNAA